MCSMPAARSRVTTMARLGALRSLVPILDHVVAGEIPTKNGSSEGRLRTMSTPALLDEVSRTGAADSPDLRNPGPFREGPCLF